MVQKIDKAENLKRIEEGQKVEVFLASEIWTEFIRPMLQSFTKGLLDARDIDVTSDKKASIEVKSRVLAANYIDSIELLLQQYVEDGRTSQRILTPPEEKLPLVKKKDYGST